MSQILNVIGPLVKARRLALKLSQEAVAARCQVRGLDLTRGTIAKIESRVRAVSDHEIPYLAVALETEISALFPKRLQPITRKPRNPVGTKRRRDD